MSKVAELNRRELENNTSDEALWHYDYRDTAYVYIGNLPPVSTLDILRVFSQYGIPTHVHVVKDNEQRPRGFAFLKYLDPRLCVLAVDNLNGVKIMGKLLRVDHTYYKLRAGDSEDNYKIDYLEFKQIEAKPEEKPVDLAKLITAKPEVDAVGDVVINNDLVDPMAQFEANQDKTSTKSSDDTTEKRLDYSKDNVNDKNAKDDAITTDSQAKPEDASTLAPRKRFRRDRKQ